MPKRARGVPLALTALGAAAFGAIYARRASAIARHAHDALEQARDALERGPEAIKERADTLPKGLDEQTKGSYDHVGKRETQAAERLSAFR